MALGRILVVDDEDSMCQYLSILLQKEGYEVATANRRRRGPEGPGEPSPVDVVMTDIQMPKMDGIQLLKGIKGIDPHDAGDHHDRLRQRAVGHRRGEPGRLLATCRSTARTTRSRWWCATPCSCGRRSTENAQLKKELTRNSSRKQIIGQSPRMRSVYKMVDKIAATAATVLINGESGTGKELIAQAIHQRSDRADRPFVAINCGAIPETLLESQLFGHVKGSFTGADRDHDGFCRQAEGGTIFLDEIGETPHAIQVKLLRMLQEREIYPVGSSSPVKVDVRVIAATNRDLEEEVARGNFRTDLFYRLNVIPLHLPALRERIEDIPLLVDHFLKRNVRRLQGQPGLDPGRAGHARPAGLRVARQRARAGERDRAGQHHARERAHHPARPAGRAVGTVRAATCRPANLAVGGLVTLEELERAHILAVLEATERRPQADLRDPGHQRLDPLPQAQEVRGAGRGRSRGLSRARTRRCRARNCSTRWTTCCARRATNGRGRRRSGRTCPGLSLAPGRFCMVPKAPTGRLHGKMWHESCEDGIFNRRKSLNGKR